MLTAAPPHDRATARRAYKRAWYRRQASAAGVALVCADQVRRHLRRLQAAGLGIRSIADAAGVDRRTAQQVAQGKRPRITRRVAFSLLRVNVDHAADHVLVDAAPTWALIRALEVEGYTRPMLARLLGYRGKQIPIARVRCSVRNAHRVRVLHECLTGEARSPLPRSTPHHATNRVYTRRMHAHA